MSLASSFSAFSSYISGVHHFGSDFCVCDRFLIQGLEVWGNGVRMQVTPREKSPVLEKFSLEEV